MQRELFQAIEEKKTIIPQYERQIVELNQELKALQAESISPLEEKQKNEAEVRQLRTLIGESETIISVLNTEVAACQKRSQDLSDQIRKVHFFLTKLTNAPSELFHEVSVPLIVSLVEYEKQGLKDKSAETRLCLDRLRGKITFIESLSFEEKTSLIGAWQIKFALLCGLLWTTLGNLPGESNKTLANLILTALDKMHIAHNGDLPDNLALRQGCISLYLSLTEEYSPELRNSKVEELVSYQWKEFLAALESLRSTLNKIPQSTLEKKELVAKGNNVAAFYLQKASELSNRGINDYDLSGMIDILNQTQKLALKPTHLGLRKAYKEAAQLAEGHPSFGKKAAGVLLAFLGAVIIVAASLALASSFGASTPLAAVGLVYGGSTLAKGVALAGTLGGAGIFAGGLGFFNRGTRQADSLVQMNFSKAAEKK